MRTAISRAPSSRSPTRSNTASTSATTLSDAIGARWRSLGRRRALVLYLTAGFPNRDVSLDALRRVAAAGADFIEVGVPFSDPLADGPTIQRTTQTALEQGMNVSRVLALVREAALAVPVIIMTYLNPVMAFGIDRFVAEAPAAGGAGGVGVPLSPRGRCQKKKNGAPGGPRPLSPPPPPPAGERP